MSGFLAVELALLTAQSQTVDLAYVTKLEIHTQTSAGSPTLAGTSFIASIDLRQLPPVTEPGLGTATVTFPGGRTEALSLFDAEDLSFSSDWEFHTRMALDLFAPAGDYRLRYLPAPSFDVTVPLTGDDYPPIPHVTNFSALQALTSGNTATIEWAWLSGSPRDEDMIVVSVAEPDGMVLFMTPFLFAEGSMGGAATSATVPIPPGRDSLGLIMVFRGTGLVDAGNGALGASAYARAVGFPIKSSAPPDLTPPQVIARKPALDAYGLDPDTEIELTFSEPMRRMGKLLLGPLLGGNLPPQSVIWSADQRTAWIRFQAPLPPGPQVFTLSDGSWGPAAPFLDLSGNWAPSNAPVASFFVGKLPVILQQPAPITRVQPGQTGRIEPDAAWPGPGLAFQWLRDGVPIPGATQEFLELAGFEPTDGGIFELVASNEHGSATSLPALLVADLDNRRPYLVYLGVSPATVTRTLSVAPGQPLEMTCSAFGEQAGAAFQWRRDGVVLPDVAGNALLLGEVSEEDSGIYDVVVSNAFGAAASNPLELKVTTDIALPTWATVKHALSYPAGWLVTLQADHQAGPGLLRGWHFNGAPIPGATSVLLEIPAFDATKAGVYTYVASNGASSAVITEITLDVRNTNKPTITQQPGFAWFSEDNGATIGPMVEGAYPFTYQWRRDGVDVPDATGGIMLFTAGHPEQAGTYTVVVRNAYGEVESEPAIVRYWPAYVPPEKPRITPAGTVVVPKGDMLYTGRGLHLASENDWSPAHETAIEWLRDGVPLPGFDQSFYFAHNVTPAHAGSYTVLYSNAHGSAESDPVIVRVLVAGDPPEVVSGPASAQVETGSEIRLAVPIVAPLGAQYACFLDGRDITPFVSFGDGHRELFIKSAQPWHSGQLTVTVSNSGGTVTAPVADVQVSGPPGLSSAHLLNVSTRSRTGLGDETVIAGFVLEGSGSKQLLIRGVASGLESFVPGRAGRDARLTVFRGDEPLASNNDWIRLSGVAAVVDAQERAGAFALDPRSDDAALLFDAPPGAYTVHLATDPSQPGIGLVEVYDLDPGFAPCRLVNLSSRVYVGNGDLVAIPGFVVAGNSPRTYLIRAVGPGLTSHGVSGVVSDPRLQVHDINLGSFLQNDDWWDQIDPAAVAAATSSAGAFELDAGSKDAAVLATLAPGAYTVVVSGAGATTGVALVEVYEVPAEESPGASP